MSSSSWLFDPPDSKNLSSRSTKNIAINLTAQGIRFVIQIVSTIVLARLLTPADFGLVAMVTVLVNLVGLFKEAGLAQATIQREVVSHQQISTLYWINLSITLGLGGVILTLSPVIVWVYNEPRLLLLAMLLALPIMIEGVGLQHRALLQRHMRFIAINRVEIISQVLAVCVCITVALLGYGYWSLVVMSIALAFFRNFGFVWVTGWMPGAPARRTGVRSMIRFGVSLTGANFVNYFARNADNFLIGKFIGPEALGLYSRAYSLSVFPLSQINGPVANALLPAMSRLQKEREAFQGLYIKWVRNIVWLTAIPIASATLWGESAVIVLLGKEWAFAGEIFVWLAVATSLQPLAALSGVCYTALGMTSVMFRWSIFGASIRVIGFCIGIYYFGVIGVAQSYAITSFLLIPLMFLYMEYNVKGLGWAISKAVALPVSISLSVVVVGLFY